jgi:predicted permease
MASVYATNRDRSARVFAGAGMTADERVELARVPRLLAIAVAVLLLIACGNVGTLSLVRSTARRRELAARLALGAPRGALVRQVALEGAVLALLAGAAGVLLARALVSSATIVGTVVPIPDLRLSVDGRVLTATLAASTLTALAVSVVPALRVLRVPAAAVLSVGNRSVGRTSAGAKGHRAVVAGQVAATLVLLAASAMIFASLQRVLARHDFLDPHGLAYAGFDIVESISDPGERVQVYRELLDAAASEPVFTGATLASSIPPFNWASTVTVFRRGEEPPPEMLAEREQEAGTRASTVTVSEGYFDLMRIRIERGRAFTANDDTRSEPVVILGRRLAEALWPDDDAVGQYVALPAAEGPERPPLRVVGVAENTQPLLAGGEVPTFMYVPFAQASPLGLNLVVRTRTGGPVDDVTWQRLATSATPEVGVSGTGDLFARLSMELQGERTASVWVGVFGLLALLLAALGTYGVLSQSVLQRTRELAVRSVLGASPASLVAAVGGEGLRLVAVGGALGLVGAVAAFRMVRSIFPTVEAPDLTGAAGGVVLLTFAMLAATWFPARRAARLDPARLLRSD